MRVEISRFEWPGTVAFVASYSDGQTRGVYLRKENFLALMDELKSENSANRGGFCGSVTLTRRGDSVTVIVNPGRLVSSTRYDPNTPKTVRWEEHSMPPFKVGYQELQEIEKKLK